MDKQIRTAFFHEDDYCQWEILPLTAKAYCLKEMGQLNEFAKAHQTAAGFTDMYVRGDNPYEINELALHPEQLDVVFVFLPPYDRVETGYSSYRGELKSTCSRGEGAEQNIFWSVDEAGLVNALWLDLRITPETKNLWRKILNALGELAPLLLADWGWRRCVDLTKSSEVEKYIEEKLDGLCYQR